MFVDNAGADILLGMIPLARYAPSVCLCASHVWIHLWFLNTDKRCDAVEQKVDSLFARDFFMLTSPRKNESNCMSWTA